MDDWAEIRGLHRAEAMGIKAIARRLGPDGATAGLDPCPRVVHHEIEVVDLIDQLDRLKVLFGFGHVIGFEAVQEFHRRSKDRTRAGRLNPSTSST